MTEPFELSLQDRPDPAVLLIDAVINRQSELAQRLSQQLLHRQGVEALERVLQGPLTRSCGAESVQWLRQQLRESAIAPGPGAPRPAVGSLLKQALNEALAPLRPDAATTAPASARLASDDPWALQPLEQLAPPAKGPGRGLGPATPAPLPADLADLRAWLHSDAA
ncbi:MAG: hypothetical protein VKM92_08305 [Cyanobacteriota bacterium]|nr:hypothetical protein [Cyanobacteriota bacterium]